MSSRKSLYSRTNFVGQLVARMEEVQVSPSRLAIAAGLDAKTVANTLNSSTKVPLINTVCASAGALGVAPGWLAFGAGAKFLKPSESVDSTTGSEASELPRDHPGWAPGSWICNTARMTGAGIFESDHLIAERVDRVESIADQSVVIVESKLEDGHLLHRKVGDFLGCVDKKDSPARLAVIQDHLYVGGDLGTQSDVRRRMGIL